MEISEFWHLIERSRGGCGDCEQQAESLIELLAKIKAKEIVDFRRHFTERLNEACRWDLWGVAYLINGGCSDDGFEYFRSWLIGQGRDYFEAALRNPESAADRVKPGEEAECEDLLYAAATAYEHLTGEDEMPRNAVPKPAGPAGNPWKEDDLEALYPQVAKKFA
jgi:hypothetical protein